MPSPWFKFSRRYVLSPYFGNPKYDTLYLWFASEAAGAEHTMVNGNREVVLRPGQFVTGRLRACEKLGLTVMEWRNRLKALQKNQLIDAKGTNRYTLITLIDPDTYVWQKGIYSRKGTSKKTKKEPSKNQQRTTTIEDKDLYTPMRACAYGEEEEELFEEESARFEAQFSPTKQFVLAVWKAERERYKLRFVKSPRNFRVADSVTAMIDAGEWTRDDWKKAVKNFMADDWAREHGGINALYEEFERWLNGGSNGGNRRDVKSPKPLRLDQHDVDDVMEARRRGRAEAAGMGDPDDGFHWCSE